LQEGICARGEYRASEGIRKVARGDAVSIVDRQCDVVRHQLDKTGCEKETWENDAGIVDKMHHDRQYSKRKSNQWKVNKPCVVPVV